MYYHCLLFVIFSFRAGCQRSLLLLLDDNKLRASHCGIVSIFMYLHTWQATTTPTELFINFALIPHSARQLQGI